MANVILQQLEAAKASAKGMYGTFDPIQILSAASSMLTAYSAAMSLMAANAGRPEVKEAVPLARLMKQQVEYAASATYGAMNTLLQRGLAGFAYRASCPPCPRPRRRRR